MLIHDKETQNRVKPRKIQEFERQQDCKEDDVNKNTETPREVNVQNAYLPHFLSLGQQRNTQPGGNRGVKYYDQHNIVECCRLSGRVALSMPSPLFGKAPTKMRYLHDWASKNFPALGEKTPLIQPTGETKKNRMNTRLIALSIAKKTLRSEYVKFILNVAVHPTHSPLSLYSILDCSCRSSLGKCIHIFYVGKNNSMVEILGHPAGNRGPSSPIRL